MHVWIVHTDDVGDTALAAYRTALTTDERQRADRFLRADDAARFVIGRALARTTLSRYADVRPIDWPFVLNDYGRPELGSRPPGVPDLRFNLSHTPGLVACGVALGREVGVDVENIERRLLHDVAERFFAADEVRDLRALPAAEQPHAFFDYWTLKEAYIKARGFGLALPLRDFAFVRRPDAAPTISFAPTLPDDAASWQFAHFSPSPAHRLAVAVRRHGADLPIDVCRIVPEVAA